MTSPRGTTFNAQIATRPSFSLNAPMVASAIALAILLIIAFSALATTLVAAFGIGTVEGDPSESLQEMVAANQEKMQTFQERFNGRSVFYKPSPWPAPLRQPTVETPRVIETPREEKTQISPVYTGPGIIYAIGDVIRFRAKTASDKPFDVRVGEEKNGVRVISTGLPWTVRVGYLGGEYDVDIWKRKADSFLLAQAPAIEIVPGLIEVPPPRPVVDVPKASGDIPVDAATASAASMEEAVAPSQAARPQRREARANREPPQGRPQAQPPRQSPPARGATAPDPEEEDEEEVDEEPDDPATEEEDPEADRAGREGAPQPDDPEEDQDKPEDAENSQESAGDADALHPQGSAEPPLAGSAE